MNRALTLCSAAVLGLAVSSATPVAAQSLEQAGWKRGTNVYAKGHDAIPSIPIVGAPEDTDWNRWAMLHDGRVFRLYFFRRGKTDTLYQFGFNPSTSRYERGFQSIPTVRIVGAPAAADPLRIAMLHDGRIYRLYMMGRGDSRVLHQFGFNPKSNRYEYGYASTPTLRVENFPRDASSRQWAMLHDGRDFRLYLGSSGGNGAFYQAAFDGRRGTYVYGHNSNPTMRFTGFRGARQDFAMLHDGRTYRLYMVDPPRKRPTPPPPPPRASCEDAARRTAYSRGQPRWPASAIDQLCIGGRGTEPVKCYQQLMSGRVNWGKGTTWQPSNALSLCGGARDGLGTVRCFQRELKRRRDWRPAIQACKGR